MTSNKKGDPTIKETLMMTNNITMAKIKWEKASLSILTVSSVELRKYIEVAARSWVCFDLGR